MIMVMDCMYIALLYLSKHFTMSCLTFTYTFIYRWWKLPCKEEPVLCRDTSTGSEGARLELAILQCRTTPLSKDDIHFSQCLCLWHHRHCPLILNASCASFVCIGCPTGVRTVFILYAFLFLGFLFGAEAGSDDSFGGGFRWRQDHLCESSGEVLPGPGGRDTPGWTATAELSAQISAQKGDYDSVGFIISLAQMFLNALSLGTAIHNSWCTNICPYCKH